MRGEPGHGGDRPRFGWLIRPIAFSVLLVAIPVSCVGAFGGETAPLLGGGVTGALAGLVLVRSATRERRWRAARAATVETAEINWRDALKAAETEPIPAVAADIAQPQAWTEVGGQIAHLTLDQVVRVDRDVRFDFELGDFIGCGAVIPRLAARDNVGRAEEARADALARARTAIQTTGRMSAFAAATGEGGPLISTAFDRLRRSDWIAAPDELVALEQSVGRAVESAALAVYAAASLSPAHFAALYGPWWRAVVVGVEPSWRARWSTISLSGFWLTVAGLVASPFSGQGEFRFATLGVVAIGVVGLAAGALDGATNSVPSPEPSPRDATIVAGRRAGRDLARSIWRWPERAIGRLAHATRDRGGLGPP